MIREFWHGKCITYDDKGKLISVVDHAMPEGHYAIEGMPPAATSEFVVAWSSPSDPATFDPTEDVCRRYNRSVGSDGLGLGALIGRSVTAEAASPPDIFALLIKATALRPDGTELSAPLAPSPLPPNLFARMERNRSQAVNGAAHFVDQE